MGIKGKLIASIEVKCGGHSIHDILHTRTQQIPNITPSKILSFEFQEGEAVEVGSVVCWKYNDDGKPKIVKQVIEAIDPQTKSITWKVIGGELLEFYNSFTIITSCDPQWTTWTFLYEKKLKKPQSLLVCWVLPLM
ncbi:hypothetical protein MTR67_016288 [Solanum verrucosum]|uniref:Bet v I/Major latex protein domain-containing protein n=1 Tax=Solanum verrucosum TaxID=315347 RepID=A0AAF0QH01_SOLVR|nr:hypothetical protein MTR67_016288 [Solanum verrucosum]